jgi:hypothetical protein
LRGPLCILGPSAFSTSVALRFQLVHGAIELQLVILHELAQNPLKVGTGELNCDGKSETTAAASLLPEAGTHKTTRLPIRTWRVRDEHYQHVVHAIQRKDRKVAKHAKDERLVHLHSQATARPWAQQLMGQLHRVLDRDRETVEKALGNGYHQMRVNSRA